MTFDLTWMAWTWQTVVFFVLLFLAIASMGLMEKIWPGGNPRDGILGLHTTRGDRLFLSLVGSAFILLGWLGVMGMPMWGGLVVALLYAGAVFRWV